MTPERKRKIADNTKRYRRSHRAKYRYDQYRSTAKRYISSARSLSELADVIKWIEKAERKKA